MKKIILILVFKLAVINLSAQNVGIGNNTPGFPLNFSPAFGNKISLSGNSGFHYGFGIQNGLLQIHSDAATTDIALGYGSSDIFTERMRIKGNGMVGIGTNTPKFPLSFNGSLGDKISLWTDGTATHYGFGIQSGLFQMFSKNLSDDIAFGYGSSTAFTERMRIKGDGNVGIGNTDPVYQLDLNSRMRIRSGGNNAVSAGLWLNNNANNLAAFIGMEDDSHVGFYGIGSGWRFGMNTQTGSLKINGTEGQAGQVLTSQTNAAPSSWDFPVKTYQWGLPFYTITSTETSIFNQNVTVTTNSSLIISVQLTILGSGLAAGAGEAYLYIDGIKSVEMDIKVDGNFAYSSVISLPNFIFNAGSGAHSLEIRVLKNGSSGSMWVSPSNSGAIRSYISVVQIAR